MLFPVRTNLTNDKDMRNKEQKILSLLDCTRFRVGSRKKDEKPFLPQFNVPGFIEKLLK